ncbi:MAG: GGDEF domain-containing protein [Phycisphaerales bacterium]
MNGASNTPARARRGRWILVGPDAERLAEECRRSTARSIDGCANIYHALGEIANAQTARPIEGLIVDARAIQSPLAVVIQSVHRVDPSVAVHLVSANGSPDHRNATDLGYESVVTQPLAAEHVLQLLGEDAGAFAAAPANGPAASPPSKPVAQESASPVVASSVDAPAKPRDTSASATRLGDIDLVECVLTQPGDVEALALKLLRQECNKDDIHLLPASADRGVPVSRDGEMFGRLVSDALDDAALAGWASWLASWLALANRTQELEQAATLDPLTGAWNRRFFDSFLPAALERARINRRPLSIMVFDVDDLKVYNDTFGHEAGDIVLCETVRLLQSLVRQGDRVCRIGGDEFVVIFAHEGPPRREGSSPVESVELIARRFQAAIAELRFPKLGPDAPGRLSVSAGLATFPWDGHDPAVLLALADQLALESKRKGKNALTIGE